MDNEVRPIDANALEKYSHPSVRGTYGYSAKAEDWMVSVGDIRNAPTLDYEPVRYGHWENERCIYNNIWIANCTACGAETKDERPHGVSEFHRYCHWCGAKMRKEDNQ